MDYRYERLQALDNVCIASRRPIGATIRLITARLKNRNGFREMFRLKIANHIAIIIEMDGRYWLVEMLPAGMKITSMREYLNNKSQRIVSIRRHPKWDSGSMRKLGNQVLIEWAHETREYDFKGVAQFLKLSQNSPQWYYCSELGEVIANIFTFTLDNWQLNRPGKLARIAPVEIQFGKTTVEITDFIQN